MTDRRDATDRWTATAGSPGKRWRNVPVPEPHLFGLLAGGLLHVFRPWRITGRKRLARLAGLSLVAVGLAIASRAVGDVDVSRPTRLVVTGPYARSRNPMYVAWTVFYAGVSLAVNTLWPLLLLPAAAAATHVIVLGEERRLESEFGEEYRDYRGDVPRYR